MDRAPQLFQPPLVRGVLLCGPGDVDWHARRVGQLARCHLRADRARHRDEAAHASAMIVASMSLSSGGPPLCRSPRLAGDRLAAYCRAVSASVAPFLVDVGALDVVRDPFSAERRPIQSMPIAADNGPDRLAGRGRSPPPRQIGSGTGRADPMTTATSPRNVKRFPRPRRPSNPPLCRRESRAGC